MFLYYGEKIMKYRNNKNTIKNKKMKLITTLGILMILISSIIIPSISSVEIEKNEEDMNKEKSFVIVIRPMGNNDDSEYKEIHRITKDEALEIKNIFQPSIDQEKIGINSEMDILNILKKYNVLSTSQTINNIIKHLEAKSSFNGNKPTIKTKEDGFTKSYLCVGPHLWVYSNPLGTLFNYNIQPIEIYNKTVVLKQILDIQKENAFLELFFNMLTVNMSLNSYLYMMGATIFIGGSLGRYWSFGLLDTAFGDMTFKIIGPFVGMYALVAAAGILIYEDPKDGIDPERPWLEIDIGVSMFSMQIETIVDFTP